MVTGVDVVREQLRIAGGEAALGRARTRSRSAATRSRSRINAECPGARLRAHARARSTRWAAPEGTDVRVDTACFPGWTIAALLRLAAGEADRRAAPTARRRWSALRRALAPPARRGRRDDRAASRSTCSRTPTWSPGKVHTRWVEEEFLPRAADAGHARRPPDGTRSSSSTRRLRDGQQSYWGMRMRAGHDAARSPTRSTAPATASSTSPAARSSRCMVRFRQENPWKGLDAIRAALPELDPARRHAHQRRSSA